MPPPLRDGRGHASNEEESPKETLSPLAEAVQLTPPLRRRLRDTTPLRSVPAPVAGEPKEDTPSTLEIPGQRYESLPINTFPGWAKSRSFQLSFDWAGGALVYESAEVEL